MRGTHLTLILLLLCCCCGWWWWLTEEERVLGILGSEDRYCILSSEDSVVVGLLHCSYQHHHHHLPYHPSSFLNISSPINNVSRSHLHHLRNMTIINLSFHTCSFDHSLITSLTILSLEYIFRYFSSSIHPPTLTPRITIDYSLLTVAALLYYWY